MSSDPVTRRRLLAAAGLGGASLAVLALSPSGASNGRYRIEHSPAEWRRQLGPQRYRILREAGTERPFSSPLVDEHRKGIFGCAGCGLPLFSSKTKFDSGTGWPSFYAALPNAVAYKRDNSMLMVRTEEHCSRCGGHLGHVFDDGPPPTGKRHCINGLSLLFRPTA